MYPLHIMLMIYIPTVFQITLGAVMFSLRYQRKSHYFLRWMLAACIEAALCIPVSVLAILGQGTVLNGLAVYLLLFFVSLVGPALCYRESVWSIILCGVSGYTAQHLTAQLCLMVLWNNGLRSAFFYPDGMLYIVRFRVMEALLYIGVYILLYLLFARKANRIAPSGLPGRNVFLLSVIGLMLMILLSSVRDYYTQESQALTTITRLFSISCCVFLLLLRSGLLERSELELERDTLRRLRRMEREQYEQSKENIELINIRCHDLKRRLEQLEQQGGVISPEELLEMKRAAAIYDAAVHTGNETLDTILTERSLYCEKNGIKFTCIVDGAKLDFMPVGDVCSLFGNVVENAVEAVSRLEHAEDRIISLIVRENRGMLVISADNYYAGSLEFEGGLPKTTKADAEYHGYGLKSVRLVAEKYGGTLTVSADEMFHLNVLLPIPEKNV